MADIETPTGKTPTPPAPTSEMLLPAPGSTGSPPPAKLAGTQTPPGEDATGELERVKAALKEANKEAASRRKQLEAFEAADATRKADEMTDLQKAQADADKLKAKLAKAEAELRTHNRRAAFHLESEKQKIQWAGAQAEADAFSLSGAAEMAEEPDMAEVVKETAGKRKYLTVPIGLPAPNINADRRNGGEGGALTDEQKRELAAIYGVKPEYIKN